MDFELLLGGQVGHVKCEQVQNAISQNRLKPIPISWKVSRVGQIWSQIKKLVFLKIGEGSTPAVKPKTSSQNVHI